jgi:rifampicin phosphotransferase
VWFLEVDELRAMLESDVGAPDIDRRRREHRWSETNPVPEYFGPAPVPPPSPATIPPRARPIVGALMWSLAASGMEPVVDDSDGEDRRRGLAGSPGKAMGPVRIIRDPSEFHRIEPGDILVCPITMASWSPVFAVIGGLVTERGGPLSHPATLAREYGIPAVLSLPNATTVLAEGSTVAIDGGAGSVELM